MKLSVKKLKFVIPFVLLSWHVLWSQSLPQLSSEFGPGVGNMMAMPLTNIKASSYLKENHALAHPASHLADSKSGTAWVEGVPGQGTGQWVEFDVQTQNLCILNGFHQSKALWKMNSRVKSFVIYLDNQNSGILMLKDSMKAQCFDLGKLKSPKLKSGLPRVKLEIRDVYPGSKFKDTCIAEIWSQGG